MAFLLAILVLMPFNVAMQKSQLGTQCLLAGITDLASFMMVIIYFPTFILTFHSEHVRFIPPENFNLALLTLELEFVKRGAKDEQVYYLLQSTHPLVLLLFSGCASGH